MPIATRRTWVTVISLVLALSVIVTVPASASSANIPDYDVVFDTSGNTSGNKGADVTCPSGTRVLGTGAEIMGPSGDVVIDEVVPTTYTVSAFGIETGAGTSSAWMIRVWAVCGDPDEATRIVSRTAPRNGLLPLTVTCDPGEFLLGNGYRLDGAGGNAVVDYIKPQLNAVHGHATWISSSTAPSWTLEMFAICAEDPPPGLWIYSDSTVNSPVSTLPSKELDVACGGAGDRQVVLGTGFAVQDEIGSIPITDITLDYLVPTREKVEAKAAEVVSDSRYWNLVVYAICAYED
ncbi:hypothetical protein [Nonomuraea sp. NPDC050202]|uniref:hypothetical protein n=1 Tax=Nonomuraea sp. NPDC050202 TaxID=3155035 RepID=UPI0033E3388B